MAVAIGDIDDDDDFDEAHDINVTPFIDVMLVLLSIIMIAAPLSTVDLPVDLPSSTAIPQKKPDKPTYVTIKADLAVAIGTRSFRSNTFASISMRVRSTPCRKKAKTTALFLPRRSRGTHPMAS